RVGLSGPTWIHFRFWGPRMRIGRAGKPNLCKGSQLGLFSLEQLMCRWVCRTRANRLRQRNCMELGADGRIEECELECTGSQAECQLGSSTHRRLGKMLTAIVARANRGKAPAPDGESEACSMHALSPRWG